MHDPLPLAGIRVLEFTNVWAGPYCNRILGDLGAEIIKVEATSRYDPERGPVTLPADAVGRLYPDGIPGERPYNRAGRFNEYNRNKLGLTLDLKHPMGRQLLKELVRVSDSVVENFSVGVLDRLGFGYEELRKLRADIVLLSMPGFGREGPEAHYVAYGPTQEAMSGLSSLTGYPGGPPMITGVFYGDPLGATWGGIAAVLGLWHRQQTGRGLHIDLSQREALSSVLPELLMEHEFAGRILGSVGNSSPTCSPHGVYPCKGADAWIVITVENDQQWASLCGYMRRDGLAGDPRFATGLQRLRNREALDEIVSSWTREQEHYALMHGLQSAGVPAEAVLSSLEVLQDPHYQARGYFQSIPHPEAGTYAHGVEPWVVGGARLPIRLPAPRLGENNERILCELLGLDAEAYRALEAKGTIGTVPVAAASE